MGERPSHGVPDRFFAAVPVWEGEGTVAWAWTSLYFLLGSNVVSNVPFILVVEGQVASLPDHRLGWELLAMTSTLAGNLTLLRSVANVIVAEKAQTSAESASGRISASAFPSRCARRRLGTAWVVRSW